MTERLPPHSMEAEMGLLGCVLADNRMLGPVADFLKPEYFADPGHERIFAAASEMIMAGKQADPVTLRDVLGEEQIGGKPVSQYLGELTWNVGFVGNAEQYGRIIFDRWLRRQIALFGQRAIDAAHDESVDLDALQILGDLTLATEELSAEGPREATSRDDALERLSASLDDDLPCYSTGLTALDQAMGGGLYQGRAYGIAGRKKEGKSMLLGTISHNLNEAEIPHLMICGEMSSVEIEQRNTARALGFNAMKFLLREERMDPGFADQINAYRRTAKAFVRYEDAPGLRFPDLRRIVMREIIRGEVTGFMVDYLQLIGGQQKGQNRAEHLDAVSQWIADACRKYNKWAVVLAQINQDNNTRGGEGMRLAFDQVYALHPCEGAENGRWLEMWDSRYTPWRNVGGPNTPGLMLDAKVGPHFTASLFETDEAQEAFAIGAGY